MPDKFPVIQVPDDAEDAPEQMGTKFKFWYRDLRKRPVLFKEARPGTGEDWAEKTAASLAELLGLPHAEYEFATWRGKHGTVCRSFAPWKPKRGRMVHGNELLVAMVSEYPQPTIGSRKFYRVSQHTLDRILHFVSADDLQLPIGWVPLPTIRGPGEVFVGYLLLDAWIANQDRHHENWGWVVMKRERPKGQPWVAHLAPTYDHASSLGRNESDEVRRLRLATRDRGFTVEAYVEKARSAIYAKEGDKRPLTTFAAFAEAANWDRMAACVWLDRLAGIEQGAMLSVFERIPKERISPVAIEFALKMLEINRKRLLELRQKLR